LEGFIQVYTGNGKGKTTAALGLALRAAGAGLKVYFAQFIKGMKYSELNSIKRFDDLITLKQYGRNCFIKNEPEKKDIELAKNGFDEIKQIISSGNYNLVVLDEITIAISYNLINEDELIALMKNKPKHIELVITGRYATPNIIEHADLVTEMKEIKHYYQKGITARVGIEK
jgi:cob(I)alamin adenosyltransferase